MYLKIIKGTLEEIEARKGGRKRDIWRDRDLANTCGRGAHHPQQPEVPVEIGRQSSIRYSGHLDSEQKSEFVEKELGVTKAFNYRIQDEAAEILKATGGAGVNPTVDFVGANYFQGSLDVAARDGRVVLLGLMSGGKVPDGVNITPLLYRRIRVEGSTLRSRDFDYQQKLRDTLVSHVLPRFEDGTFKPWRCLWKRCFRLSKSWRAPIGEQHHKGKDCLRNLS